MMENQHLPTARWAYVNSWTLLGQSKEVLKAAEQLALSPDDSTCFWAPP
jgi:hypothetical protein